MENLDKIIIEDIKNVLSKVTDKKELFQWNRNMFMNYQEFMLYLKFISSIHDHFSLRVSNLIDYNYTYSMVNKFKNVYICVGTKVKNGLDNFYYIISKFAEKYKTFSLNITYSGMSDIGDLFVLLYQFINTYVESKNNLYKVDIDDREIIYSVIANEDLLDIQEDSIDHNVNKIKFSKLVLISSMDQYIRLKNLFIDNNNVEFYVIDVDNTPIQGITIEQPYATMFFDFKVNIDKPHLYPPPDKYLPIKKK